MIGLPSAACGGDATVADAPPPALDADPSIDAAPPRETMNLVQPLAPSELVEAKMVGGAAGGNGDRAIIKLTAPTATLDWNIHAHPNGSTVTVHEELRVMTAEYDFIPNEKADWFLLLRNGGGVSMDVQLEIKLYGAMTFTFL
ncbi:MAG: hypothetical protein KF773_34480 [Deltaproteobacteria bacterium]|nr:hypothetical protein [Deltaproteobacteria bacterium]MCW5804461.1 hypothetical protein [Deltaproteobacteria bacterium]